MDVTAEAPRITLGKPGESCPFCGRPAHETRTMASCAFCGMKIDRDHVPHILLVDPAGATSHFCSIVCMDNFEFLEEAAEDA
jgi:ribosomal protein L24E